MKSQSEIINLLRRIGNHLSERETYEEATTRDALLEEISAVLKENELEIKYSEASLISFGNYLLSDKRRKMFEDRPEYPNKEMLEERLSQVHHADIVNWFDSFKVQQDF